MKYSYGAALYANVLWKRFILYVKHTDLANNIKKNTPAGHFFRLHPALG
jgi:hypothetical protein